MNIEGNKLIAEFLGMWRSKDGNSMVFKAENTYNDIISMSDLTYNSSWNELMPVVSKIGHLARENEDLKQYIESASFNTLILFTGDLYAGGEIREVYQEVVQIVVFIRKNTDLKNLLIIKEHLDSDSDLEISMGRAIEVFKNQL